MSAPIASILPVTLPQVPQAGSAPAASGEFHSVFEKLISGVERSQNQAQQSVDNFLSGGNEDLHSVALASQRASLEFDMFLQMRNKVVSAYQEVMRMQL